MDERTGEVSRDKDPAYTSSDRLAAEASYYDIEGRSGDPGEQGSDTNLDYSYRTTDDLDATTVDNSNSDDNTDDQTQAIRADIEQTRASLSDTINEIQERLNPQTIVEQAKDSALELIEHAKDSAKDTAEEAIDHAKQAVHDATIGKVEHMVSNVSDSVQETGSGLMGLIKSNPVPAALAGLGLGWLYMKRNEAKPAQSYSTYRQNRPSTSYGSYSPPASFSGGYPAGNPGSARMSSPGLPGQLIDSVKQNPVPAALAGLSIGYMMMQGQGQQQAGSGYQSYSYPVGNAAQSTRQGSESLTNKVGNLAGGVGDKVGDIASGAGDVAGNVASTAGDVVGNVASGVGGAVGTVAGGAAGAVGTVAGGVGDVVGNVASGAGDVVGNVAEGVGYQAERVTNGLERLFNDKPLVVGAMAVGVGAFIGLMLPETQQERQLLGEARDQLVGKVQDVASQTMDKVGQVADEVQSTVKREAEDKGLIQS